MSEQNYQEKDVAFYSATLAAWYTTKFEKDKHLLSLSVAGIGLLVTLATAIGTSAICTALMYILAVFSYLLCVISVLFIFDRNANHLESLVKGRDEKDSLLSLLDKLSMGSFVIGIIFTLLVGLFSAIENYKTEEIRMSNDTEKRVTNNQTHEKKSVNGAGNMKPPKPQPNEGQTSGSSGSKGK